MIDKSAAWEAAQQALLSHQIEGDSVFTPWVNLDVSAPRLVSDLSGQPSYWVVPLLCAHHPVGFVRVMSDGAVAAIGITCRKPESPELCSVPAFALSPGDIEEKFLAECCLQSGETPTAPRLVHDGPPGREAWLIEIRHDGFPARWIFVGLTGIYERPAGTVLSIDSERE